MRGLWQVEIDQQCQRVLSKRFPYAERFTDINGVGKRKLPRVDVICGGWPCQDHSIAGKREGFAGERSSLFHEFARVIRELKPELVVWENVPGLLSSDAGRDSLVVLRAFADLDFHGGWRMLDSQYFGVAQRRDRIFGVFARGRTGARRAAEILAVTESRSRDTQASRQAGQGVAATLRGRSSGAGVSAPGRGGEDDSNLVCFEADDYAAGSFAETTQARPLTTSADRTRAAPIVCGTLSPGAHPGSYNGQDAYAGQLVAAPVTASNGHHGHSSPRGDGSDNLVCGPLPAHHQRNTAEDSDRLVIPIDMRQASRGDKMTNNRPGGSSGGAPGTGIGNEGDHCPTLADSHVPSVAYTLKSAHRGVENGWQGNFATGEMGVRRLMPVECLRLQGFPDDWLDLTPPLSDSAKYRMIGNAVTVTIPEWLGRRIVA